MAETILIVDDEESVRLTFREWLESEPLDCRIESAADAEAALVLANSQTIDLAILDWNLGAGDSGLQLLEDLYLFNPDVVALLITGYAHQATPLDAMRLGVRDYLDKNQDLDRHKFLAAVRKQLERIRPAKRERVLHQSLLAFREAVEKVQHVVQALAALNDPVPLPEAVRGLFRFLIRETKANAGVMLVRSYDASRTPPELTRAYDSEGQVLNDALAPFGHSLAGGVCSLQRTCALLHLDELASSGTVELQSFERGRESLLAVPLEIAPGMQVVLELFDKQPPDLQGFNEEDQRKVEAGASFAVELLRQALAERQTHRVLLDAVSAALQASGAVSETLSGGVKHRDEPPPQAVLDQLRQGLRSTGADGPEAAETVRLAEAIRVLAVRHGPPALRHCATLVEDLRRLLDEVTREEYRR